MNDAPLCMNCVHYRGLARTRPRQCTAFGDGDIPLAIWLEGFDHRHPYPGDGGIRFEPKDPSVPLPLQFQLQDKGL